MIRGATLTGVWFDEAPVTGEEGSCPKCAQCGERCSPASRSGARTARY